MIHNFPMHILAITPGEGVDHPRWQRVLHSGIDAFMIREPQLDARDLLVAARWVRETAPKVALWVNGRLDVALASQAGLHTPEAYPKVPEGLLPLSCPIHDPAQIPWRRNAHQLVLSPIFGVPGKNPAWGAERLHGILDGLPPMPCRILALGGITPATIAELKHSRLDGVAVIRALWASLDPALCVTQLREAWQAGTHHTAKAESA
jgi:thiamine monophosphate synthase